MDVSDEQLENAELPILVTVSGIVTDPMNKHDANDEFVILVHFWPKVNVTDEHLWKHVWFSGITASNWMCVNEEQYENASSPMLVTLSGIVMDVRDVQE